MKKIKGHFCSPSNPSDQTRPVGLAVMFEHRTPKGVCQVTSDIKHGNGQHLNQSNFKKKFLMKRQKQI